MSTIRKLNREVKKNKKELPIQNYGDDFTDYLNRY